MPRRIDVELTSARDDGSWTWRASGAREPRGVLDGSLLPAGAKVGDEMRAEADFDMDGVTIISIGFKQAKKRNEADRIEVIGRPPRDEQLVTSTLASRSGGDRRDRGDRGERRDRGDRGERRDRGDRGERDRADRGPRSERGTRQERGPRPDGAERPARRDRPAREGERPNERTGRPAPSRDRAARPSERRPPRARPDEAAKPKPKRLRPSRVHRAAVLEELPPEHRPIAEQVLAGDIPAVRQAIDKENQTRVAAGQPTINGTELLALAEKLRPRLRTAEWRDRAESAMADVEVLDLRDLRSVVVAADSAARDDETRALATQLRDALTKRVEAEQAAWIAELTTALDAGRVVRALRLSSRPPKAGTILDPNLSARLAEGASTSLTAEAAPDRWAAVLDATAFSPVRLAVKPQSVPLQPGEELVGTITRLASRVPLVAAAFGVEATEKPARTRGPRSKPVPPPPPIESPTAPPPAPAAAEPTPEPSPLPSAEQIEQIERAPQNDVRVEAERDAPSVPSGEGEPAADGGGAEPIVLGVADEHDVAGE
jgi:hypothetical protein